MAMKPHGARRTKQKSVASCVVEDEPSISGFVRRGLHFEGYEVDVVPDGPGALRTLRDSPPDLLVLDVMVPGVDGLEIARRLRAAEAAEQLPAIPILMLTARDAVVDRVTGLRAGADDYLVKPFDFDELLARIEALLRRLPADRSASTRNADVCRSHGRSYRPHRAPGRARYAISPPASSIC